LISLFAFYPDEYFSDGINPFVTDFTVNSVV